MSDQNDDDLEWRDDGTPVSRRFDDVYYSVGSGLNESLEVFIDGNRLRERWSQAGDLVVAGAGFRYRIELPADGGRAAQSELWHVALCGI